MCEFDLEFVLEVVAVVCVPSKEEDMYACQSIKHRKNTKGGEKIDIMIKEVK